MKPGIDEGEERMFISSPKCPNCGSELTESGHCPKCGYNCTSEFNH